MVRAQGEGEGERDLTRLLAGLAPSLDPALYRFVFSATPPDAERRAALMSFREAEGWTLILPADWPEADVGSASAPMARLTLRVHSSLEAIGLTAAVAGALTQAGISANVVAAYHHDHLFVPAADGERALAVLEALAARTRG
ncbi:MAG: ACT domain-containing protein [Marivibrio sp.]|uniref:ACT domain-containing protein n=1 Tax=Marivibrio sp. TaxID=2039719 RepID=UPI0032EDED17